MELTEDRFSGNLVGTPVAQAIFCSGFLGQLQFSKPTPVFKAGQRSFEWTVWEQVSCTDPHRTQFSRIYPQRRSRQRAVFQMGARLSNTLLPTFGGKRRLLSDPQAAHWVRKRLRRCNVLPTISVLGRRARRKPLEYHHDGDTLSISSPDSPKTTASLGRMKPWFRPAWKREMRRLESSSATGRLGRIDWERHAGVRNRGSDPLR